MLFILNYLYNEHNGWRKYMIVGIGLDIVELSRIRDIVTNKRSFVERVLTDKELEIFDNLKYKRQVEYLAGRFACKEAFSKAYGTGIGKLGLQDIEILTADSGQPIITKSPFHGTCHVSISHTDTVAVAQIILEDK